MWLQIGVGLNEVAGGVSEVRPRSRANASDSTDHGGLAISFRICEIQGVVEDIPISGLQAMFLDRSAQPGLITRNYQWYLLTWWWREGESRAS